MSIEGTGTGAVLVSAHSAADDAATAADELAAELAAGGAEQTLVTVFFGHRLDAAAVAGRLTERLPGAKVIGCSTAGEFTERTHSRQGAAAVAFPRSIAPRVAIAHVDTTDGPKAGVSAAVRELAEQLGAPLRELDPDRYVGLVLIDGLSGLEEEVNEELGKAAPFLSFVGGSAGDDLDFVRTSVVTGKAAHASGAVLAVVELAVPFTVLKTCSFVPSGQPFTVTRVDQRTRTVYELDGRPVIDVYAEAAGVPRDALDTSVFMAHPFGVMIEGQPWIRSPQQVTPDGGLKFYCQLVQDTKVHLMDSTDLIADTRSAVAQARERLGGHVSGAVLFNCILRRLELDAADRHEEFLSAFDGIPLAGFHTYGESWLGHINQTCTGVMLGARQPDV